MYAEESPAQIQTPTHWNLTGLSLTAPSPVLSPSSILPPPCAFIPTKKNSARIIFFYFFWNCVIRGNA